MKITWRVIKRDNAKQELEELQGEFAEQYCEYETERHTVNDCLSCSKCGVTLDAWYIGQVCKGCNESDAIEIECLRDVLQELTLLLG